MTVEYETPSTWRLKTTGSGAVPYKIVSMSGEFADESAKASATMLVPANRLSVFAAEMLPAVSSASGFPIYPTRGRLGSTPMFARRITWKGHVDGKPVDPFGIDSSADDNTYQLICEVTVDFDTSQEDQENSDPDNPETFLEVSCSGAGEFIHSTVPQGTWATAESESEGSPGDDVEVNKLQSTSVNILVPEADWNVTWPRIPKSYYKATLMAKIRSMLGKVNSEPMPLFFDAPKETILFIGFSLSKQYTWRSAQDPPFKLDLKFLEKHVTDDQVVQEVVNGVPVGLVIKQVVCGHNHCWKADMGWMRLKYNGTDPIYQLKDLNGLFQP